MQEGMPDVHNAGTIHLAQLKFEEEIGAGSFGSVYKGTFLGTVSPFALIKYSQAALRDCRGDKEDSQGDRVSRGARHLYSPREGYDKVTFPSR